MTITKQQIKQTERFARKTLDALNWWHTQQVRDLATVLAKKEGADAGIVEVASLLHDIGKSAKKDNRTIWMHHITGAEIARKLLEKNKVDSKDIEKVLDAIKSHVGPLNKRLKAKLKMMRISLNDCPRPRAIEAKCVYDADMINWCGPSGIAKAFWLDSRNDTDFKETARIMKIESRDAYNDLQTASGKRIGRKYREASKKFFEIMGA